MGILLDNLYTKSKEVTAEAILNETIQKSLNAEELTDNEKNAVGKYFLISGSGFYSRLLLYG